MTAQILKQGIWRSGRATSWQWRGCVAPIRLPYARGLIARRPRVISIATDDYPTRAQRPAYSVMDTTLLCAEYGLSLPEWRAALATTACLTRAVGWLAARW